MAVLPNVVDEDAARGAGHAASERGEEAPAIDDGVQALGDAPAQSSSAGRRSIADGSIYRVWSLSGSGVVDVRRTILVNFFGFR